MTVIKKVCSGYLQHILTSFQECQLVEERTKEYHWHHMNDSSSEAMSMFDFFFTRSK